MQVRNIIDKLYNTTNASREELLFLLDNLSYENKEYLIEKSHKVALKNYGKNVYIRGLIEFTNYCIRDCKYCGIRKSNGKADRYRLTIEEILECADIGDRLGYKTYVLQGGEDPYFTDEKMVEIIKSIKEKYPNNAITLSLGERSYKSYEKMFNAGADRYLLRHETATKELYDSLHPNGSFENRRQCLRNLKEIGYQIGAGFMVGLPNQNNSNLIDDLIFLKELNPHMCGIGPFIPHKDTPFKDYPSGSVEMTLFLLSLCRIMLPNVLLPATTALGTVRDDGRKLGVLAGANVIMPNLSPVNVRKKYMLYNNKSVTADDAGENLKLIQKNMQEIGYEIVVDKGD